MNRLLQYILFFLLFSLSTAVAEDIVICYARGYEPFSGVDKDGKPQGVLIDFVDEIVGKRLGISIKHQVFPWARSQMYVREGKADAFFTIPTPERREYTLITKTPLYKSNYIIWTGATNPHIENLKKIENLKGLKNDKTLSTGYIIGAGWHVRHLGDVENVIKVVDSPKLLQLLKFNRIDYYIEQEPLLYYQIKELSYQNDIIPIETTIDVTGWHLCIGKHSSFSSIMPKLNALLEEMERDGSLEKLKENILKKYR